VTPRSTADESGEIDFDIDVLRRDIADALQIAPGEIDGDTNLVALGLDSVKMIAVSGLLRRHGLRVRFSQMVEDPTLEGWWRLAAAADEARHRR
jgi:aryl carrier-like protein